MSDLAKYSMTHSIAWSLYSSWGSYHILVCTTCRQSIFTDFCGPAG